MMLIPDELMPHGGLVSYRRAASGSAGVVLGDPVTPERACLQDQSRLVRNQHGELETSSTALWLDPEHFLPLESQVTVWVGTPRERTARIISRAYLEHGPDLPTHCEYNLE